MVPYGGRMHTWTEFAREEPELAAAGRAQLYQWDIGLGFLATVRPDGAPRVHPVCPMINDDGLLVLIVSGPKQYDLARDGRYALHSETCPPPRHDDGFSVAGRARAVDDPEVKRRFGEQLSAERGGNVDWPTFVEDRLFELLVDRALLTLTDAGDRFPKGPTVWPRP
jgi:hypothetical protein